MTFHASVQENSRQRRERAAARIKEAGAQALLVSDLKNVEYLSGFNGSNAALLLKADATSVIATDGRYITQIAAQTGEPSDMQIHIANNIYQAMKEVAGETDFCVEPTLSVGIAKYLGDPDILEGVVEGERLVKDDTEIAKLVAAGELADNVWQEFIAQGGIAEGLTEIDAAADLENRLRRAGADGLSFPTILASGSNGSKPHAGVSRERIVPGLVTVDFGIYLDGYASDQTRTVCVGDPSTRDYQLYDIVYRAQKAGEAMLRPGAGLRAIDTACRTIIEDAGYGEFFVHSTGHGVGMDVHEAPRAAATVDETETLVKGMTLTVEPGIYLPGETGLRIENTYVITEDSAQSLNASSTELIVV
ncbi:M24 family metallopeptidase [Corynebacterium sp. 4HC-13]|uniref:M24 family metallopeptidase n=1 Tax=Corynebacterium anserum TaxID=2684406 RepID=UPI001639F577|nr:M24 family metallopeptidase [Corynebacterium anserum]MBC2681628.1 M24 family metallopeptidase [Corynebacterium anserum]